MSREGSGEGSRGAGSPLAEPVVIPPGARSAVVALGALSLARLEGEGLDDPPARVSGSSSLGRLGLSTGVDIEAVREITKGVWREVAHKIKHLKLRMVTRAVACEFHCSIVWPGLLFHR